MIPDEQLDALRARSTRLVFLSAVWGNTSLYAAFTVAPLIARDLTGSRAWSGIPGAAAVAGTAAGAALLSRIMERRGRGVGLRVGWIYGLLGAGAAVIAARAEIFLLVVVGMALMGIGHSANQLSRFTAADMHPEADRPRVLAWVVWAAAIGAVAGPTLAKPLGSVATRFDLTQDAGGFIVAIVFFAAAVAVTLLLKPDPTALVVEEAEAGVQADRSLKVLLALPHVRAVMLPMLVSQAVMVMVMTITPVHARESGHGLTIVGLIMSAHFFGMFALSPLAGRSVARFGPSPVMRSGLVVLTGAAIGAGVTSGEHAAPAGAWLFLLGLGWNLTFVAGSSVLTRGLTYRARARVQGGVDAINWTASALASIASGFLLQATSFRTLSLAGAVTCFLVIVVVVGRALRPGPVAEA